MKQLPIIDMSALFRASHHHSTHRMADQIGRACHETGFVIVNGHGIPPPAIRKLRSIVMDFFSQTLEEKLKLSITRTNYRGYIPLGFFTPNAAGTVADHYEGYKLHYEAEASDPICRHCDLYGPNKWATSPAGFKPAIQIYWQHCDRVAGVLLDALARHLEMDQEFFRSAFVKPLTNMTLLHYPSQTHDQSGVGIHAHKDTDALTILAPDPVGGLWIKPKGQGDWLAAEAPPGALIVNIGDMLETWSGGYYTSTPHKVINASKRERYSFPYFSVPRFDVMIEPLSCGQAGFDPVPASAGELSRTIWRSNWPDAAPIDPRFDPAVR